MSKDELLARLAELDGDRENADWEDDHITADELLLEYVNDPEITKVYKNVGKWYS